MDGLTLRANTNVISTMRSTSPYQPAIVTLCHWVGAEASTALSVGGRAPFLARSSHLTSDSLRHRLVQCGIQAQLQQAA